MAGDNIYEGTTAEDYRQKFELPYKPLLDAGVTFHTSLGNHDDPAQRLSPLFHMNGDRYYTFTRGPVQFFALDSTDMTPEQVLWLQDALAASTAPWKIAYFHHPLYSSGMRHGPDLPLRRAIEPVLVAGGVQVVFSGHEHFYERLEPQRGIQYFISGAGGQLRRGNIRRSTQMAAGFDQDNSFMIVEATRDTLWFESVSRLGDVVDAGTVQRASPLRGSGGLALRAREARALRAGTSPLRGSGGLALRARGASPLRGSEGSHSLAGAFEHDDRGGSTRSTAPGSHEGHDGRHDDHQAGLGWRRAARLINQSIHQSIFNLQSSILSGCEGPRVPSRFAWRRGRRARGRGWARTRPPG
jgi:hypothetical protein